MNKIKWFVSSTVSY